MNTRGISWAVWHAAELAALAVTLLLAAVVSAWFLLAAGLVVAAWCVHEWRLLLRKRALLAIRPRQDTAVEPQPSVLDLWVAPATIRRRGSD